jgi:hypothetical protein
VTMRPATTIATTIRFMTSTSFVRGSGLIAVMWLTATGT